MIDDESIIWEKRFDELAHSDYVIIDDFLAPQLLAKITAYFHELEAQDEFNKAAIGSTGNELIINEVRGDYTYWLDKNIDFQLSELFDVLESTRKLINRHCYLSLSDFEFHFAHYPTGSFYKKHLDQFAHRNNRMISMIIYLNENWQEGDGGELKIYPKNNNPLLIPPLLNRCVMFRSDTLEHEVVTAVAPRRSLTGWMLYAPSVLVTITP